METNGDTEEAVRFAGCLSKKKIAIVSPAKATMVAGSCCCDYPPTTAISTMVVILDRGHIVGCGCENLWGVEKQNEGSPGKMHNVIPPNESVHAKPLQTKLAF